MLASVLQSCSKPAVDAVSIVIGTPTEGQTVDANKTIAIKASINAQNQIHGYTMTLRNKTTNQTLLTKETGMRHAKNFEINETWTNNVGQTTDVELELVVYLNHSFSETKKQTLTFKCLK